jgi:hypothetical protein
MAGQRRKMSSTSTISMPFLPGLRDEPVLFLLPHTDRVPALFAQFVLGEFMTNHGLSVSYRLLLRGI